MQERVENVTQCFKIPMDKEHVMDDYPESDDLVETYYDNTEESYLLIGKLDEVVKDFQSMEEFREYAIELADRIIKSDNK